jgi:hypothetical protein
MPHQHVRTATETVISASEGPRGGPPLGGAIFSAENSRATPHTSGIRTAKDAARSRPRLVTGLATTVGAIGCEIWTWTQSQGSDIDCGTFSAAASCSWPLQPCPSEWQQFCSACLSTQQVHDAGPLSMQTDPSAPRHKNSEAPLHDALCTATSAMISSRFAMNSIRSSRRIPQLLVSRIAIGVNFDSIPNRKSVH